VGFLENDENFTENHQNLISPIKNVKQAFQIKK